MKIIFLGPPGSGKGTYASRLSPILNVPHISTGDILRENVKRETELGRTASEYMEKGKLVPDKIIISMIKERISQEDCRNGFILDGFPRTINQAKELDRITEIDAVINLAVPEDIIIKRLTARRVCEKCGAIYNILTLKPKEEGICDRCGGRLIQRKDDTEEVIKKRLEVYKETAKPIIEFYENKKKLYDIEINQADASVEEGVERILKVLKSLNEQ